MINISLKYSHKYGTRMSTHSRDWTDAKLNIIPTNQQNSTFFRTYGYRRTNRKYFAEILYNQ